MSIQALPAGTGHLVDLLDELTALNEDVQRKSAARLAPYRARYPQGFSAAARNLADYLALRSHELRPLQERLVAAGLSSLGRGESQVCASLARVINMLGNATGVATHATCPDDSAPQLVRNTEFLFGTCRYDRHSRIMVTLPGEAAAQPDLIRNLVENGMDCARINCAHDNPETWQQMIAHVHAAAHAVGTSVRIFMDLSGHKIRTSTVKTGPAVRHLQVSRDDYGHVTRPAGIILTSKPLDTSPDVERPDLQRLPVDEELSRQLRPGHSLHFRDTRDKHRVLRVTERLQSGAWLAECDGNAYVTPGTRLRWQGLSQDRQLITSDKYCIGDFTGKPQVIRLFPGELLLLRRDNQPGMAASTTGDGSVRPAQIGCSHPDIVTLLRVGDSVWIDDGKLGCIVTETRAEGALLKVTHAGPRGARIRSGKGINLPDTALPLPALTANDLDDLDFVCAHADIVGFSFVRRLDDIDVLRHELATRGKSSLPIVLKIETAAAVNNLPDLLLGTLGQHALGVMIARGDLAVELGSVRMAEIQEEILWICEAAQVPVIWATQVLDTLARKGVIARPEITDAAMSVRAECVMLNKGPFIIDAVSVLKNILTRMDAHQYKKVSRLRRLHW
ncbi:MAG: pyruvate kinase [Gammaproteobacteria bacterium]